MNEEERAGDEGNTRPSHEFGGEMNMHLFIANAMLHQTCVVSCLPPSLHSLMGLMFDRIVDPLEALQNVEHPMDNAFLPNLANDV